MDVVGDEQVCEARLLGASCVLDELLRLVLLRCEPVADLHGGAVPLAAAHKTRAIGRDKELRVADVGCGRGRTLAAWRCLRCCCPGIRRAEIWLSARDRE